MLSIAILDSTQNLVQTKSYRSRYHDSTVTGAPGHLGRLAVQQLLARGVPPSDVVAVVRTRGVPAGLADDDLEHGVGVRTNLTGCRPSG